VSTIGFKHGDFLSLRVAQRNWKKDYPTTFRAWERSKQAKTRKNQVLYILSFRSLAVNVNCSTNNPSMSGNSRFISSAQSGVHADLAALLQRHLAHPFRKPILDYNRVALAEVLAARANWQGDAPLILDAGCGVGWSTLRLAERYPKHFVIGVDQSVDRINRGKPQALPANAVLIRADLVDFWRLLAEEGIRLDRHYNLYPNPWPKIGHLARRWHGHAVFPTWLALGGEVECRSNWSIYIEEMAQALSLLSGQQVLAEPWETADPITPFEKKYLASGHELWRCRVDLR
jgi:tRNA (guanine-N7-)-methyltransferase